MASRFMLLLTVALCLGLIGADKPPEVFTGRVVSITDADTIHVLIDEKNITIRLNAVDAPEMGQPFSTQARHALGEKVQGKTVRVSVTGKDRYGRDLGDVILNGESVNEWLLKEGWAWHFLKYSTSKRLTELEAKARTAKKGLWADAKPEAPWDYRERMAQAREAKRQQKRISSSRTIAPLSGKSSPRTTIKGSTKEESPPEIESVTVYITKTGEKYHSAGCRHLSKSKIPISLEDAKARGFGPCVTCGSGAE